MRPFSAPFNLTRGALLVSALLALANVQAEPLTPAKALDTARALLQPGQAARQLANASPFDTFTPMMATPAFVRESGAGHARFDRQYHGLRVIGGDIVVHFKADGQLDTVVQSLSAPLNLASVVPAIDKADALARALEMFRVEGRDADSKVELVVDTRKHFTAKPALAWLVEVRGGRCNQPSRMHYVFDALDGKLLGKYESLQTGIVIDCSIGGGRQLTDPKSPEAPKKTGRVRTHAPGVAVAATGKSLYYGTVSINTEKISDTEYRLRDTTRGSHFVSDYLDAGGANPMSDADNSWGDGVGTNVQTLAVDAAYGQSKTWDYYKSVLGRNGLANDGAGYKSEMNALDPWVGGALQGNAYWDGSAMHYGVGDADIGPPVSLDWAGHEMTHGVTQTTAAFDYSGEAGGLNESTSDIFGTMVEYYAKHPNDTPDYTIFEKTVKKAGWTAWRFMYQPSKDSGLVPSHTSYDCWDPILSSEDPHYSSGLGNHFFYLLAEGSQPATGKASRVCKTGDAVTATDTIKFVGLGRTKAAKLWYDMLTSGKTTTTATYADVRKAMLEVAPANSDAYRHADYAWAAVNVTDVPKVDAYVDNWSWQKAQIVEPAPELVLLGRRGVSGKAHWFALYLDPGKSAEASLTAGDAASNFDLAGYDDTKKLLVSSKSAGGAKEKITLNNAGDKRKLFYVSAPYLSGNAPYLLRMKRL